MGQVLHVLLFCLPPSLAHHAPNELRMREREGGGREGVRARYTFSIFISFFFFSNNILTDNLLQ